MNLKPVYHVIGMANLQYLLRCSIPINELGFRIYCDRKFLS